MTTDTTLSAYDLIQESLPALRAKVYSYIRSQGLNGATIREVVDGLGQGGYPTYAARCTELYQAGTVVRYGRRQNTTGRSAHILVAADLVPQGGDYSE